jgi:hypothetical protein
MPSPYEQTGAWQTLGRENSVLKPHKPLPRKRDTTISSITSPDLRAQYRSSSNGALNGGALANGFHDRSGSSVMHSPTTPVLPPTPPIANHENGEYSHDESSVADTTILRSSVVTPINQQTPPTPEQTPPRRGKDLVIRPWLATQPSMASTRAESFATAREEFLSDTESEHSAPHRVQSHSRNASHQSLPVPEVPDHFQTRPSPLADANPRTPQAIWEDDDVWNSHELEQDYEQIDEVSPSKSLHAQDHTQLLQPESDESGLPSSSAELHTQSQGSEPSMDSEDEMEEHQIMLDDGIEYDSPTLPQQAFITPKSAKAASSGTRDLQNGIESSSSFRSRLPRPITNLRESREITPLGKEDAPRRGPSLRDRLEAIDRDAPSASTENFASQIGWSENNGNHDRNRPASWRMSGISNMSTVDAIVFDTEPRRIKTIRRQTKSKSLRTASSPLPTSNRSSILTNPYGSLDSPPRHSLSHKKARLSNQNRLSYGSDASRSLSMSSAATPSKPEVIRVAVIPERRTSLQSSAESNRRHSTARSLDSNGRGRFPSLYRNVHTHRLSSDGASVGSCNTCGKDRRYPPPVPPRASSLSAPTSRNNSKANSRSNSITSEHLRVHRLQAERDLRKTLDRMQSERIAPTVKAMTTEAESSAEPSPPEPGTEKWASLRPTSTLDTPFSQPSVQTASGDGASIEMGEARAVNLFPHNNDSLQLIEKHPLPESRAVRSLRHTNPAKELSILIDGPPTPRAIAADVPVLDSPLRNPREAPPRPAVHVVPPTPTALPSMSRSQSNSQPIKRYTSLRRHSPAAHRYSASFIKSMTRGLSLKNARNPKSDVPQLDERLAPMWRPRRFWDDTEYTEDESEPYGNDDGEVRNTLDMAQPRAVVNGPVSLLRSISGNGRAKKQRQGQRGSLYKQSSYGSMSRLRAARTLYRVPGLKGVHFQFVGLGGWSERVRKARGRREDEERERRRRMLREAIGPEVISQGDSRFLGDLVIGVGRDGRVIH